ncbi:hypothetical protein A2814_03435 [Candidatus Nomurabacteria bacterium RIFCSPHIGHO2_01_FULL_38_19]|uniref:Type 4 fimbrial biogenesis protein PilX N-terminal domain-containing protein n=1 Tax=Candidatus Nomurabacteria bacterium RIFCSPHIGHO2_01_FULL_38_19 TaxID=1801732 RepID=A0A1F6UTX7_9BACT|nr:MAG: hypothetical protein A2814_03435 [Candidatus Nomurabacteria bacterium RIFCSPHIGHO2_01_FULL_38_19]
MIYSKQKTQKKTTAGFIALMSAIIISVILLLIAVNLSFTGFYSRSNILDSEFKARSSALAEACVDTVLLNLANNPSYTGEESITVSGTDTCEIGTIVPTADPIIVEVTADFQNAITNLHIEVNQSNLSVESWEEKI